MHGKNQQVQKGNPRMHTRQPAVYIMANRRNGTIYTGVTSDLIKRIFQHKHHELPGFTKKYNCNLLV
jgi:putative endonuclease